eukprot:ANDGO_02291.mRNA.1 Derlin-2
MTFEQWYKAIPPVTRFYMTACFVVSVLCTLEVINPLRLSLNISAIRNKHEWWRIFTNFFYFQNLGINFLFHMHFIYLYFNRLEEDHFHRNSADFFMMLLFGSTMLLILAPFLPYMVFLSFPLVFMGLYIWSRKNPMAQMAFWGVFTFSAPYLPWVLLSVSILFGGIENGIVDLLGIFIGHIYYYFTDIYPLLTGHNVLRTPRFIKRLFGQDRPPLQDAHGRPIRVRL